MNAFLWFCVVFGVLEFGGRLIWLASGNPPQRTPGTVAVDAFVGALLTGWAGYLLVTN